MNGPYQGTIGSRLDLNPIPNSAARQGHQAFEQAVGLQALEQRWRSCSRAAWMFGGLSKSA